MVDTYTHFYTPSIAETGNEIWCAFREVNAGPESRIWLGKMDAEAISSASVLVDTSDLIGDCELIPSGESMLWLAWSQKQDGRWETRIARIERKNALAHHIKLVDVAFYMQAVVDSEGNSWLVYQTNDSCPNIKAVCINKNEQFSAIQLSPKGFSSWKPSVCSAKDGLFVAWDSFIQNTYNVYMRKIAPDGTMGDIIQTTEGSPYDRDASICSGSEGDMWISWMRHIPWPKSRYYRLCIERDIFCRRYDVEENRFYALENRENAYGGRVPIPLEYSGLEAKLPLNPEIIWTESDQAVRILFRQIAFDGGAPHSGERLRGWDLNEIVYRNREWSDVHTISEMPGYSSDKLDWLIHNSRLYVVYNICKFPGERRPPEYSKIGVKRLDINSEPERGKHHDFAISIKSSPPENGEKKSAPESGSLESQKTLLWGDLHRHSDMSHCLAMNDGNLWDHFRWAKDVAELDFYALTDHEEHINTSFWYLNSTFSDLMNRDGSLATICGMEISWGGREPDPKHRGHINAFCLEPETGEQIRKACRNAKDIKEFYRLLDEISSRSGDRILVIKHFHAVPVNSGGRFWKSVDADSYRSEFEPVMEAVQNRGFAMETMKLYLDQGLHFGFIGGTDHGRPHYMTYRASRGAVQLKYKSVLTGVWSAGRSRAELITALFQRRCYVTNGPKTVVEFRVNDRQMGECFTAASVPVISLKMKGTRELLNYSIYRDGQPILVKDNLLLRNVRSTTQEEITFEDKDCPEGKHYYYAEVSQLGEEGAHYHSKAITSPIWVTYSPH